MGIQATLHGYRVQFLYTLYRMMRSDNPQEVYVPEGKEDLDVYVDGDGEIHLGGSASNAIRVGGHAKDSKTARLFSSKVGLEGAWDTPIGEQYNGN